MAVRTGSYGSVFGVDVNVGCLNLATSSMLHVVASNVGSGRRPSSAVLVVVVASAASGVGARSPVGAPVGLVSG